MNAKKIDKIAIGTLYVIAGIIVTILAALILYILVRGIPHISWSFLTSRSSSYKAGGGIGVQLYNSFFLLVITLIISVPLSMGAGIFLSEYAKKGRTGRKIRAMILGIPNVGKSSFINRISKRTTAGVGNKPGVTKQKQWIRINEKIELLDTPGVLWPKFESEEVALHLCFTGSIKEEILDKLEIAYQLTKFLLENYRKKLCERYKLDEEFIEQTLKQDQPENNNIYEIMLEIGKKRGCIMSGGRIDEEKTSRLILDEFKNGKLGKITIEQL